MLTCAKSDPPINCQNEFLVLNWIIPFISVSTVSTGMANAVTGWQLLTLSPPDSHPVMVCFSSCPEHSLGPLTLQQKDPYSEETSCT